MRISATQRKIIAAIRDLSDESSRKAIYPKILEIVFGLKSKRDRRQDRRNGQSSAIPDSVRASFTRSIRRLERHGLVERCLRRNGTGRGIVTLTESGERLTFGNNGSLSLTDDGGAD